MWKHIWIDPKLQPCLIGDDASQTPRQVSFCVRLLLSARSEMLISWSVGSVLCPFRFHNDSDFYYAAFTQDMFKRGDFVSL